MEKIDIESCLKKVKNRFDLIILATTRSRHLIKNKEKINVKKVKEKGIDKDQKLKKVNKKNIDEITIKSLKEISEGKITPQNIFQHIKYWSIKNINKLQFTKYFLNFEQNKMVYIISMHKSMGDITIQISNKNRFIS